MSKWCWIYLTIIRSRLTGDLPDDSCDNYSGRPGYQSTYWPHYYWVFPPRCTFLTGKFKSLPRLCLEIVIGYTQSTVNYSDVAQSIRNLQHRWIDLMKLVLEFRTVNKVNLSPDDIQTQSAQRPSCFFCTQLFSKLWADIQRNLWQIAAGQHHCWVLVLGGSIGGSFRGRGIGEGWAGYRRSFLSGIPCGTPATFSVVPDR